MTREELHALVDARFDELEALQEEPTFLSYEQKFAQIWTQLGCNVLQATLGKAPLNSRKKTSVKPASGK
ncbi:hypothetical protein [Arsenicibacter rosenii]|uniref:Uncharacterized protein n=1 Tax=Arsenicibacter rosenii TaxID=1750698 RepID=A0A1S2VQE3_9BACT|nr:hypothetical protein [Arsenicibacter rosenii]OIN60964.1 hypothetical protein BLX24_02455 [Arsenicibacter rosenii]